MFGVHADGVSGTRTNWRVLVSLSRGWTRRAGTGVAIVFCGVAATATASVARTSGIESMADDSKVLARFVDLMIRPSAISILTPNTHRS